MASDIRYARSGEAMIAHRVVGDGPLDLVFVPGFVSHVEVFWEEAAMARLLERLASFARVILWDKRGQGLSDRFDSPPTLEEGMDDLLAVLAAVGSERAALYGASEGVPLSILFAATYPARTSALIAYGGFARMARAPDFPAGVPPQALDAWVEQLEAGWGSAVSLELFAPSAASDPRLRAWWAHLLRSGTSPRGVRSLIRMYKELDVRGALSAVSVPTLVLQRTDDQIARVEQGRYLAEHIEGARCVELPGADHLLAAGDLDVVIDEVEEFLTGSRAARDHDRVLATVLFTDIVGSTERAAQLGDRRWGDLLSAHDALIRRHLERFRGREVKTLGDGFLATFDGPARAIRCAAAIERDARGLGIDVRAGVHTGEVDLLGDDVGGLAVSIGARVGALADAGEVLVSGTVRDLVVGSGLRFESRGERQLKGVPGEWRIYALAADGVAPGVPAERAAAGG